MSDPRPILYSFRRCPYAMRARLAIASAGITCRLREVVLRDKPAEMLDASPKGTVPVVVLPDGRVIDESLDVMDWALAQNDPESWLSPDVGTLSDMRALIAQNDGQFKHALDRYKYPNRYENVDALEQRETGFAFLTKLNSRLENHTNLFGDTLSLADMAIFPFVRQFANTDRAWFDTLPLPKLQDWLKRKLESQRFAAIMGKYPQWHSGDPEPDFPPNA